LLFVFCSHAFSDHRGLPSFPTRRSSDLLGIGEPRAGGVLEQAAGGAVAVLEPGREGMLGREAVVDRRHTAAGEVRHRGAGRGVGDRKSTRLNSSHVSTSYAVFCLKKKNK